MPESDVTVEFTSTHLQAIPAQLTFSVVSENGNTFLDESVKSVSVTYPRDFIATDSFSSILYVSFSSSDTFYDSPLPSFFSLEPETSALSFTISNIDEAGVHVEGDGLVGVDNLEFEASLTEGSGMEVAVFLATAPTEVVEVTLVPVMYEGDVGDVSEMSLEERLNNAGISVSTGAMVFDEATYNSAQYAAVSVADNSVADTNRTLVLQVQVTSSDPFYSDLQSSVLVISIDDDDKAGLATVPSSFLASLTEGSSTTFGFSFAITSQPISSSVFTFHSPDARLKFVPATVSYSALDSDWSRETAVVVSVLDDSYINNHGDDFIAAITVAVDSSDHWYQLQDGQQLGEVKVVDNDAADPLLTTSSSIEWVESSGIASYSFSLKAKPRHPVTVSISGFIRVSDVDVVPFEEAIGTVNTPRFEPQVGEYTISPANWQEPISVTIVFTDNTAVDGTQEGALVHTLFSEDPDFADDLSAIDLLGDASRSQVIIVYDDDGAETIITPLTLSMEEGSTQTLSVSVTEDPTSPLSVSVSVHLSDNGGAVVVTASPSSFELSSTANIIVTIASSDDLIVTSETLVGQVVLEITGDDSRFTGNNTVPLRVFENDLAEVVLASTPELMTEGDVQTLAFTLSSQPTSSVTFSAVVVTADSSDASAANRMTIGEVTVDPESWEDDLELEFTSVDDARDDMPVSPYTITVQLVASGNAAYTASSAILPQVSFQVLDNDDAGVVYAWDGDQVSVLGAELDSSSVLLMEGDSSEVVLSLALRSEPTAAVTAVIWHDSELAFRDADGSFTTVAWEPSEWKNMINITFTAHDDLVDEGPNDGSQVNSGAVRVAWISVDELYRTTTATDPSESVGASGQLVGLVPTGDDDTAGISAEVIGTSEVTEGGDSATVQISLNSVPLSDITVTLSVLSGVCAPTSDGTGNSLSLCAVDDDCDSNDCVLGTTLEFEPSSIVFSAGSTGPKEVSVSAADDDYVDGDLNAVGVSLESSSSDANYILSEPSVVEFTVFDNDMSGFEISYATGDAIEVVEGRGATTVSVRLLSRPWGDVFVKAVSDNGQVSFVDHDGAEAVLTVSSASWANDHTVSVQAIDDDVDEEDPHTVDMTFGLVPSTACENSNALSSVDAFCAAALDGLQGGMGSVATHTVSIMDNDFAGLEWQALRASSSVACFSLVNGVTQAECSQRCGPQSTGSFCTSACKCFSLTNLQTLYTQEGGYTDVFRVRLRSQPTAEVTFSFSVPEVNISHASSDICSTTTSGSTVHSAFEQVALSTSSVTFTSTNWDDWVLVTATAVADNIEESGDHSTHISVLGGVSNDPNYAGNTLGEASCSSSSFSHSQVLSVYSQFGVSDCASQDLTGEALTVAINEDGWGPPPVATNAVFSSDLRSILVTFDKATNTPSGTCRSMLRPLASDGDALPDGCTGGATKFTSSQAAAAFGTNALCSWSDSTTLRVLLGSGFTLSQGQFLQVQSASGIRAGSANARRSAYGAVEITLPATLPTPVVTFQAPATVGSCMDVSLDASRVTNAGGRGVGYTYEATAVPQGADLAGINDFLSGATKANVLVPESYLNVTGTYTFAVTVSTWYGKEAQSTVSVSKILTAIPQIQVGSKAVTAAAATPIRLRSSVAVLGCNGVPSGDSLIVAWYLVSGTLRSVNGDSPMGAVVSELSSDATVASESSLSRNLFLPAYRLTPGEVYEFMVKAVPVGGSSDNVNSETVQVTATFSSLSVGITQGSNIAWPRLNALTLTSTVSDPDAVAGSTTYTWSCNEMVNGQPSTCPLSDIGSQAGSSLAIAADTFNPNAVVRFTVTATKGSRSASARSTVTFVAGDPPQVTISTDFDSPVFAEDDIVIQASASSGSSDISYEWSQDAGDIPLSAFTSPSTVFPSGTTSPDLEIGADSLTPGVDYVFRLSATTADGTGFSTVSISVALPPSGGQLSVLPSSGEALSTQFLLSLPNWQSDYSLRYSFFVAEYQTNNEGGEELVFTDVLSLLSTVNNLRTTFGPSPSDGTLIVGVITDAVGASSIVSTNITVTTPSDLTEEQVADEADSQLVAAQNSGDAGTVFRTISQFSAFLREGALIEGTSRRRLQSATASESLVLNLLSSLSSSIDLLERNVDDWRLVFVSLSSIITTPSTVSGAAITASLDIMESLVTGWPSTAMVSDDVQAAVTALSKVYDATGTNATEELTSASFDSRVEGVVRGILQLRASGLLVGGATRNIVTSRLSLGFSRLSRSTVTSSGFSISLSAPSGSSASGLTTLKAPKEVTGGLGGSGSSLVVSSLVVADRVSVAAGLGNKFTVGGENYFTDSVRMRVYDFASGALTAQSLGPITTDNAITVAMPHVASLPTWDAFTPTQAPVCAWYDGTSLSRSGCALIATTSTTYTCACREIGDFMVLQGNSSSVNVAVSPANIAEEETTTVSLSLTSAPLSDVVVQVSSASGYCASSATTPLFTFTCFTDADCSGVGVGTCVRQGLGLAAPSPQSVTFTPANWQTTQTVSVTAEGDDVDEGSTDRTFDVKAVTGSEDLLYSNTGLCVTRSSSGTCTSRFTASGITASGTVSVSDDDTAGVTVSNPQTLEVDEGGSSVTGTYVLTSQPLYDVTVTLTKRGSSAARLSVSPATLRWTASNWSTPITVTYTAVDDAIFMGDASLRVVSTVSSFDTAYSATSIPSATWSVVEDDVPGLDVSTTSFSISEAGGQQVVQVKLLSRPEKTVSIRAARDASSSAADAKFTVSPSELQFTSSSWNTYKTFTITGTDDSVDNGDRTGYVTLSVVTLDAGYAAGGYTVPTLTVQVQNDDVAGMVSSVNSLNMQEGDIRSVKVTLKTRPLNPVTVSLSAASGYSNRVTIVPATATIAVADFSSGVTFQVSLRATAEAYGTDTFDLILASQSPLAAGNTLPDDIAIPLTAVDLDEAGVSTSVSTVGVVEGEAVALTEFCFLPSHLLTSMSVLPSTAVK